MPHIFISYSHRDSDYAYKLAEALDLEGFNVWIDKRIGYGASWPRVIQEQLDGCAVFIVIMTPRSYESDWVLNELLRAMARKKTIFPLLLEGETWLYVQARQYIDVREGQLPPTDFYETVARSLQSENEPAPQEPQTIVICFGVHTDELLETGVLPPSVPTSYPQLCDWLEQDLENRVSEKIDNFEYPEPSQRNGETLSVRIAFQYSPENQSLDFELGWWEILEVAKFKDIYPQEEN